MIEYGKRRAARVSFLRGAGACELDRVVCAQSVHGGQSGGVIKHAGHGRDGHKTGIRTCRPEIVSFEILHQQPGLF